MAESSSTLEDYLTCPVCLEKFKEPVTLGCNHSFCSSCLQDYWDKHNCKICPLCRRKSSKDQLKVNFKLKQMSHSFEKKKPSAAEEGVSSSKPPQVSSEPPREAQAVDVACIEHPQVAPLFCWEDAHALCLSCEPQHQEHTLVPVEEAVSQLKTQLKGQLEPLTAQREQASLLQKEYEEVQLHSHQQVEACTRHIREHFERLQRFLQREEQLRLTALREEHSRQIQTMEQEMEKLRELLFSLKMNISAVHQVLKMNHIDFITHYSGVSRISSSLLSEPTPRLGPGLLINQAKVLGNMGFKTWQNMMSQVHYSPVILDPNTANASIILSEDLSGFIREEIEEEQLPDNPERFFGYASVLGSEGFTSGSHQWDVEVGDHPGWGIGVARESVNRYQDGESNLDNGVWCIEREDEEYNDVSEEDLILKTCPQRIRVRVDYDQGKVSFYNTEDMSLICSHTDTFKEKLYPYFSVGPAGDAKTKEIRILSA